MSLFYNNIYITKLLWNNTQMPNSPLYLTPRGRESLGAQLEVLDARQEELFRLIGEAARRDPDLPENTEFKQHRAEVQFEIPTSKKRIRGILDAAVVLDTDSVCERPVDEVWIGSIVELLSDKGVRKTWTIVGHGEGKPDNGTISYDTPLGTALLGKKPDDVVSVNQKTTFTIVSVARDLSLFEEN